MNPPTSFGMDLKRMGSLAAGTAVGLAMAIIITGLAGPVFSEPPIASVTIPFEMDHNRMFVEVEFVGTDGASRKARAWVDTGNEALVLQEPLARDLGYEVPAGKEEWVPLPKAPGVRLNGWPLDSADVAAGVLRGPRLRPGLLSEAQLPARLFRKDDVVFDYPARRLTVAKPGLLKPRGVPVPCRINPKTGLFLVEAVLDGEAVALGVAVKDGLPAVKGVRPGDRLLRVNDLDTAGAAMGTVVDAMRGKPGSMRTLILERRGKSFIVKAKTMRFA
jgi:hypothetical protein